MGKEDVDKLLKAIIRRGRNSVNLTDISLGEISAKKLGLKSFSPKAKRIYLNKDFVGFTAKLNLNSAPLRHWIMSEIALNLSNRKKIEKLKRHPYLRGSPELIINVPLESTEKEKRRFLTKAEKYFKKLVRYNTIVILRGQEYPYIEYKKLIKKNPNLANEKIKISIQKKTLQHPKGQKETLSSNRKQMEKRTTKFISYAFHCEKGTSYRKLARIYKVNKDTIRKWVEEIKNLSEDERRVIANEVFTSKQLPNIDILDLPQQKKVPISEIEYKLSNKPSYH